MANYCKTPVGPALEYATLIPQFVLGDRGETQDGFNITYVMLMPGNDPIIAGRLIQVNSAFAIIDSGDNILNPTGTALFDWKMDLLNIQYGWVLDRLREDIHN